ncbi:MAG: hypothetical protein KDC95_06460 [Planctomycetes bacterium]|nr:hypothetical protein [Planctomycetota bacterium]
MSILLVIDTATVTPIVLIGASIGFTISLLCLLTNHRERAPYAALLGVLCCAITFATVAAVRRSEAIAQLHVVIAIVVTSIQILLVRALDGQNAERARDASESESNEHDG